MTDQWIVVPNWEKFQHYNDDRNLVWIKVYLELRERDDWGDLSYAQRGCLITVWMEFGASRGILRVSSLSQRSRQKTRRATLDSLAQAGWIQLSASKPPKLSASKPASTEKEVEKKKNYAPAKEAVDKSPPARAQTPDNGLLARFDNWVKYEGFEYVDDADAFIDELRRRKFILDVKAPLASELLERARGQVHA